MALFSSKDEGEYSEELQLEVIEFLESLHPEDEREPYHMVELIFNVPELEAKNWVRSRATSKLSIAVEDINPNVQANLENITESLKMIKKSMQKLEQHNQLLIQKWKEKKKDS